jgi:membrane protein
MILGGYRVGPLLKKTGSEILDDNVFGLAAQTAYYFFFSLFPLLLFVTPLLSVIGDKRQMVGWILTNAGRVVPAEAMSLVSGVVKDVVLSESAPGLMSVGALLAAWSGSNIFGALMGALNRAYDVRETRPWIKQQIIRLASLVVAGAVLLLATAVMLGGEQIVDWIGTNLGLSRGVTTLWKVLQFPLAFGILVGAAWMIYYFLPNVKQRPRHVLVAALGAGILWVVGTLLFRAYVQNFGSYNKTYGAIGGVIALLTWMYLTMLILLAGGELASELHCGTARVEPERGATYAGRIGSDGSPGRPSTERVERVEPLVARGSE